MSQDDPVTKAWKEVTAYTGEAGERETRRESQAANKLTPTEFIRENRSARALAQRTAFLAGGYGSEGKKSTKKWKHGVRF